MSMNQQPPKSAREIIKLKRPMSVAIYDDYTDAAHAVDYLADRQFPVATLAIVGTDLRSVERVTGSMSWGKVLAAGFVQGAMWAGMFAIIMWVLQPGTTNLLNLLLMGLLGFGLVGMAMSALQYRIRGSDRDYTSTTAIIATHYEVLAEAEYADRARGLLSGGSLHQARQVAVAPPTESMVPPPQQADLDKLPPPAWPPSAVGESSQPTAEQTVQFPPIAASGGPDSHGASNLSYGQYWKEGDAPGIGDLPKRFGEADPPADTTTPENGDQAEAQSPRRGDSPESAGN